MSWYRVAVRAMPNAPSYQNGGSGYHRQASLASWLLIPPSMRFAILASLLVALPAGSAALAQSPAVPQARPLKRAAADARRQRRHHRGRVGLRRGLADRRAGDRLRHEGADRRRHADRRHGGALRLRRRRVLHRRPDVQPQQPRRSRRRSAGATTSPRPSTSWSRWTPSSIAAPRSSSASRASGVRLDRFHATDSEETFDLTFDLVWEAAARQDADGWTAEIWIPLAQLRFNPGDDLTWGLNIQRFRPTLNEQDTWVLIPRTVRAWASWFGDLRGLTDLTPSPPPRGLALRRRRRHPAIPRRRPATRSPTGPTWSAASAPT